MPAVISVPENGSSEGMSRRLLPDSVVFVPSYDSSVWLEFTTDEGHFCIVDLYAYGDETVTAADSGRFVLYRIVLVEDAIEPNEVELGRFASAETAIAAA